MAITAGTRLGCYEILSRLGAGGMGEVYRAKDTRLKREVAVKVLPEAFAADPERMARFQREAEALAALNHPNIAQIYSIEENALVMELIEGEHVSGPLGPETAISYARQITDALEAAHEKGIVHRDLKPANVMVTASGTVKILDFGLAAFTRMPASDQSNSPTVTISPTRTGMILGTAGYMSPEQARGRPADKRADIWAFGVMLYEMLTGTPLFQRDTVSDTLAAVLKDEPDWEQIPVQFRKLLQTCLEKDPKRRLRDIGDAWVLLEKTPQIAGSRPKRPNLLPWVLAALASFAAVVLAVIHYRTPAREDSLLRFNVSPPENARFTWANNLPVVSPDGHRVVFAATVNDQTSLWIQELDALAARPLPGTDRAIYPFWRPDSRYLAFFADGKLKKIDVSGGPAVTLCDVQAGRGGSWSKNDVILFTPTTLSSLMRVPAGGGSPVALTQLDTARGEDSHRFPWFLPDGRHYLYTARNSDRDKSTVYVADIESKDRRALLSANSNVQYSSGYVLFVREANLMAQPFDSENLRITGDAAPVAERISYIGTLALGRFSSSQTGILAYTTGLEEITQLTWVDRSGKPAGTIGDAGLIERGAISPDGQTVAVSRMDLETGNFDIWLHELNRARTARFTFGPKSNLSPVWSPDGNAIVFASTRKGSLEMLRKSLRGNSEDELMDTPGQFARITGWTADRAYLVVDLSGSGERARQIWLKPLSGDQKAFRFVQSAFDHSDSKPSPTDPWIAYVSNETKRNEVYVQLLPPASGKWQISTSGGSMPVWSRDGKELFFLGADRKLMSVQVKNAGKLEPGTPKELFPARLPTVNIWFDVSKDGRFLMPVMVQQPVRPFHVVVNWNIGLRR